ncbi:hypothetical protein LCGC14_1601780 [marine sediment metagenome]|uniref:Uncharacterized protein n=1 Tax=marine sediment metagenome TaxID=412755 RepID=A0A0F9KRK9_9ZZZZ
MKKGIFLLSFILGCYGTMIVIHHIKFEKEKTYREKIDRKLRSVIEENFETQNERFNCAESGGHDMEYISTENFFNHLYHDFRCKKCFTHKKLTTDKLEIDDKKALQQLDFID